MRVAITGMGLVSAAGIGVPEFRRAIEAGLPGDSSVPELIAPAQQARIGAVARDPAYRDTRGPWDRAIRWSEVAAREAASQAGFAPGRFPAGSALVLGTSLGAAESAQRWHEARLGGRRGRRSDLVQAALHATTDKVAWSLGLDGPRTTISNACVSGTNALGIALDMVRAGEAEVVVAGGVDTLHRFNFCGFATLWALTSERCRPFDSHRTGMLLGEAAAFLVVESEASLRRRGGRALVELAGYGAAGDAVHITAPCREGGGAFRSISMALADAGVTPEDVDFVSLHGTGTMYADGMEAAAMGRIFGERVREVPATSLRPVTGHTMGSAGSIDTVACVLAIEHGFVPPTPHHNELDPGLAAPVRIVTERLAGPVEVALNTSSGFAGSNASVVLRRWDRSGEQAP